MDNQQAVFDLIEWLEKAAYTSDMKRVVSAMDKGMSNTCVGVGVKLHRHRGIHSVEYIYNHSVERIRQATRLADEDIKTLKEFIVTIPSDTITVVVEHHEQMGEVISIHQMHHIPEEMVDDTLRELNALVAKMQTLSPPR